MKNTTLLNCSILTSTGVFSYKMTTLEEVKKFLSTLDLKITSAIGHKSTADILTELLGRPVNMNRIQYEQQVGEIAIVFKLRGRPEECKILSKEEIEKIGYDFFFLEKLS